MVDTSQLTSASDNSFLSAFKSSASNSSGYKSPAINPIETNKTASPFSDKFDNDSDMFSQLSSGLNNKGSLNKYSPWDSESSFDTEKRKEQEKLVQRQKFLADQKQQEIIFSNLQEQDNRKRAQIVEELKKIAGQTLQTHNKELHITQHVTKSKTLESAGSIGFIGLVEKVISYTISAVKQIQNAERWAQESKAKAAKKGAKEAGGVNKGGIHQMYKGNSAEVSRAAFAEAHPDRGANAGQ